MISAKTKIAIFGASLNPPGNHHLKMVKKLTMIFDRTIVVLSGIRPHKSSLLEISPVHRKNMTRIAFAAIKNVELDFYDIDNHTFSPTWLLQEKYQRKFPNSEIWFAIGADLIKNGRYKKSEIQRLWQRGSKIWKTLNYAVFDHSAHPANYKNLPPHNMVIKMQSVTGRSILIRKKVALSKPVDTAVPKSIAKYIASNNLYQL